MPYSYVIYIGNGSQRQFDVTFPYLSSSHVSVTVDGIPVSFTWVNPTRVELATAPPPGASVRIQRSSSLGARLVDFTSNSLLKADDLDLADTQLLYLAQELADASSESTDVTFLSLPDTPSTYEANKWVKVNSAGTALEFTNPPTTTTTFLGLTDTPSSYTDAGGKVVTVKATEDGLEFTTFPSGVTTFLGLTDTPSSYTGHANKYVKVNNDANALEFGLTASSSNVADTLVNRDASGNFSAGTITAALNGNASTASQWQTARTLTIGATGKLVDGSANVSWTLADIGMNFLALTDTPSSYVANKWVKVNSTADALEFTDPPGGVGGSGIFATIPYWTTSNTLGSSELYWDANNKFLGINYGLPECLVYIRALTPHNAQKPAVGVVCDVPTGNHGYAYFPMTLTGTYKGTYTNQYEIGWGGYTSRLVYGSASDAATGTILMNTTWETVYGEGHAENEHCAWMGAEICSIGTGFPKTTGPVGRYWLADLNLHGPVNVQPGALVGFNVFMNNYYNGQPAHGPSCAMWLHTEPGSGGWAETPHYNATSYPIDVALGISGYSGTQASPNSYGFRTGIQIGGWGGGWKNNWSSNKFSKLEYGIRLLEYGVAAIHIGDRSSTGANAILIKNNGGSVGIWTETPADALHVAGGNVRISDGGRLVCPDMYPYTFAFFDNDKKLQPAGMIYNSDGSIIVHPENYTPKAEFDIRPIFGNSNCYVAISPKDGLMKYSVLKMYANSSGGTQEWVAAIAATWTGSTQADERLRLYAGHGASQPEERVTIGPESAGTTLWLPNSGGGRGIAYAWITYSDKKDKSDIRYVDESYLSKIQALKPAKYKFKGNLTDDVGFIAQDVQEVLPEAVVEASSPDGEPMLALNINAVVTALVKAVQELASEVQSLKGGKV